jgi:NitT/TauT family transport system substrate-binding protein
MRLTRASRRLPAAAALAVTMLAAACSSQGTLSQNTSAQGTPGQGTPAVTRAAHLGMTSITVGALPIVDDVALYLAQKEGYFEQAGLHVTIKPVAQSTAAIPDMKSGSIDIIAGANYASFFQADATGAFKPMIVADAIACQQDNDDILALPSSGIKSPADLAGKTIAVNLTHNIQTLMISTVLRADNVNPASVHYVAIPFPKMISALKAHKVDAISPVEPFITQAELQAGAETVLSECTGPTADFPLSGYIASQSWAEKYPSTARAFQSAIERAQALADSDRAAVEQILPTYSKISPEEAAIINLGEFPTTLDATHLQRAANLMYTGGLLHAQLNVNSLLLH